MSLELAGEKSIKGCILSSLKADAGRRLRRKCREQWRMRSSAQCSPINKIRRIETAPDTDNKLYRIS